MKINGGKIPMKNRGKIPIMNKNRGNIPIMKTRG